MCLPLDLANSEETLKFLCTYIRFHQIILKTFMIELIDQEIEEQAHKNAWRV